MKIRVAVNGLGRIGRCIIRASVELGYKDVEIVAVNGGSGDIKTHAHLLRYDSVHGYFGGIEADDNHLIINGRKAKLLAERNPAKLPWKELGVDIVLECTGAFKGKVGTYGHITAGAKKVIMSAPGDAVDATIVYGVNNAALRKDHEIISIGSCTTNALAPLAKTLNDAIGIERGYMTTIHSYTNDQTLLDAKHHDLRRARAAGLSIVPTTTGAAKALGEVIPELTGKLDGTAIRVPTPNVSMVDLVFVPAKATTKEKVNAAAKKNADGAMRGILSYNDVELVSSDFIHSPFSSIFDATLTKVVDGGLVRTVAWYDNEWGFSCRMLDVSRLWASL